MVTVNGRGLLEAAADAADDDVNDAVEMINLIMSTLM